MNDPLKFKLARYARQFGYDGESVDRYVPIDSLGNALCEQPLDMTEDALALSPFAIIDLETGWVERPGQYAIRSDGETFERFELPSDAVEFIAMEADPDGVFEVVDHTGRVILTSDQVRRKTQDCAFSAESRDEAQRIFAEIEEHYRQAFHGPLFRKAQFLWRNSINDRFAWMDNPDNNGPSLLETWLDWRSQTESDQVARDAERLNLTYSELDEHYRSELQQALGDGVVLEDVLRYAGQMSGDADRFLEAAAASNTELAFLARTALNVQRPDEVQDDDLAQPKFNKPLNPSAEPKR